MRIHANTYECMRILDVDVGEATPSESARDTNVCQGWSTSKAARRPAVTVKSPTTKQPCILLETTGQVSEP